MFTMLEKEKALKLYEEIGKVTGVIQKLGYNISMAETL